MRERNRGLVINRIVCCRSVCDKTFKVVFASCKVAAKLVVKLKNSCLFNCGVKHHYYHMKSTSDALTCLIK